MCEAFAVCAEAEDYAKNADFVYEMDMDLAMEYAGAQNDVKLSDLTINAFNIRKDTLTRESFHACGIISEKVCVDCMSEII